MVGIGRRYSIKWRNVYHDSADGVTHYLIDVIRYKTLGDFT